MSLLPKHIVIRADASPQIGVGHVTRCLVLADELARCGIATTVLAQELTDWTMAQLIRHGHNVKRLVSDAGEDADAKATIEACRELDVSFLLLDHYALKTVWCDRVAGVGIGILALDDLAESYRQVALLIDPGLGREPSAYAGLIPATARCLAGADYALLRPEFAGGSQRCGTAPERPKHVVVALGGSDPDGQTLICLEALEGMDNTHVSVVLTSGAPHLPEIEKRVKQMDSQAELLVDHDAMAELYRSADLVLGAGGSSSLERCALGVPSMVLIQAENQKQNATWLNRLGAAELVTDPKPEPIRKQVMDLLESPDRLRRMSNKARDLCDAHGGVRAAQAIIEQVSDGRLILAKVTQEDCERVFSWQTAPGARRFSRIPEPPEWDTHKMWFADRLKRSDIEPFYVIHFDDEPVGFVRLDSQDDRTKEVSILVATSAQGKGVARTALALLRLAHSDADIIASVNPLNVASQAVFLSAGYKQIAPDLFVSRHRGVLADEEREV